MKGVFSWIILLVSAWAGVVSFNLDASNPIIFKNSAKGSYFGYSVALMKNGNDVWLLAGAPRGRDTTLVDRDVRQSGTVFKCNVKTPRKCTNIPFEPDGNRNYGDHVKNITSQWLGVSLDVEPKNFQIVVICAHRFWFKQNDDIGYVPGFCYELNKNFGHSDKYILQLKLQGRITKKVKSSLVYYYAMAQMGTSVKFAKDGNKVAIGLPGLLEYSGGYISYKIINNSISRFHKDVKVAEYRNKLSYTGYSLAVGKFFNKNKNSVAAGSPRRNELGGILFLEDATEKPIDPPKSENFLGSSFGAVVEAADLNNDGYDDLLVGAPTFSQKYAEEGRVFIYYLGPQRKAPSDFEFLSQPSPYARFGSALADAGDLNYDGFADIVVGAPFEDSYRGAIYIYNGQSDGMSLKPSQVIKGRQLENALRAFGASFSRPCDINSDKYNDIAVGAFLSDQVVLLRSRPVIHLNVSLTMNQSHIDPQVNNCIVNSKNETCTHAYIYTNYSGVAIPSKISITYKFQVDSQEQDNYKRALIVDDDNRDLSESITKTEAYSSKLHPKLITFKVLIKDKLNILVPIQFQLKYYLSNLTHDKSLVRPVAKAGTLQAKVEFALGCGDDKICVTDLKLSAKMEEKTSFLLIGEKKDFSIVTSVQNAGENAYSTIATIVFPMFIRFKPFEHDILCTSKTIHEKAENLTVTCDIGNPIPENKITDFNIRFSADHLPMKESFYIKIQIATTSEETKEHLKNNEQTIRVPIRMMSTFDLITVSRPEQLFAKKEKENTTLTHVYEIINIGPSILLHPRLEIDVPQLNAGKDHLLSFVRVSHKTKRGSMTGHCSTTHSENAVTNWKEKSSTESMAFINCSVVKCIRVVCEFENVTDNVFVVEVDMRLQENAVLKIQGSSQWKIISNATLTHLNNVLYVETIKILTKQTVTDIFLKRSFKEKFEIWIIIVCVISAAVLLIFLIFLLIKCGFFKRKKWQSEVDTAQREPLTEEIQPEDTEI